MAKPLAQGGVVVRTQRGLARLNERFGLIRRAGHGRLIAEHMEVPIAASVALPDAPIRTVDLMPTILERLDVTVPSGVALDGAPFFKHAATTEPLVR
jgi:hypothetical protein